jgi:hypothetical protein
MNGRSGRGFGALPKGCAGKTITLTTPGTSKRRSRGLKRGINSTRATSVPGTSCARRR